MYFSWISRSFSSPCLTFHFVCFLSTLEKTHLMLCLSMWDLSFSQVRMKLRLDFIHTISTHGFDSLAFGRKSKILSQFCFLWLTGLELEKENQAWSLSASLPRKLSQSLSGEIGCNAKNLTPAETAWGWKRFQVERGPMKIRCRGWGAKGEPSLLRLRYRMGSASAGDRGRRRNIQFYKASCLLEWAISPALLRNLVSQLQLQETGGR